MSNEYYIKCAYCEKEFISHHKRQIYCSKRCKDIASRIKRGVKCNTNEEPYYKVCAVCGTPYETFREASVTCSTECAKEYHRKRPYKRRPGQVSWEEYNEKRKATKEERLQRIDLIRHIAAVGNLKIERECKQCGRSFHSQQYNAKYCSAECRKKWRDNRKDKRVPKDKVIDTDITLPRLFKRDSGKCWICGCQCDWDDKRTNKSGQEYPGDTYPTKDHVIPISRGGAESWDNVRLACWKCNCVEKRDGIYPYVPLEKEQAYSCKAKGNPPKRTAQYTLDGTLIKVWESTGSIQRELGLSSKHIQNICRKEKSKTGIAYGSRWEYV